MGLYFSALCGTTALMWRIIIGLMIVMYGGVGVVFSESCFSSLMICIVLYLHLWN